MLIAMAYVMITENLHDQTFLDKYTVGFEKFRMYAPPNNLLSKFLHLIINHQVFDDFPWIFPILQVQ